VKEGIRKITPITELSRPTQKKVKTKRITINPMEKKKESLEFLKVDNPSSFVTNVFQKIFRVSPLYSEPKHSILIQRIQFIVTLGTVGNVHYFECTVQIETPNEYYSEKASGKNKKESKLNALTKLYQHLVENGKIPQTYVEQGKNFFSFELKK
jgi:hypothetical protein